MELGRTLLLLFTVVDKVVREGEAVRDFCAVLLCVLFPVPWCDSVFRVHVPVWVHSGTKTLLSETW